jgi:hypothetical protein
VVRAVIGTAFLAGAFWLSRRSHQDALSGLGDPVPSDLRGEALNALLSSAESLYPTVELIPLDERGVPGPVEYASDSYRPRCNTYTDEAANAVSSAYQAEQEGLDGSKSVMVGAVQAWALGQFMCDIDQEWVEKLVVGA